MILTTKNRYAVIALAEMAQRSEGSVTNLTFLSEGQHISHSYLEQLFIKLRNAKIINAINGSDGGYKLNMPPEEITIYKIIEAVEDEMDTLKCDDDKIYSSLSTKYNLLENLEDNITNYLNNITLADIINESKLAPISPPQLNNLQKEKIYLDYNATTPLNKNAKKEMDQVCAQSLNPSSLHWHGRNAKAWIENARSAVAKALGIKLGTGEYQITFTSSGTEANNLIFHNFVGKQTLVSKIEHLSILQAAKEYTKCTEIKVDSNGQIDDEHLLDLLQTTPKGSLISIIMANNETGIIQKNIQSIINLAHAYGMFVHSDAVQAFGKIPLNLQNIDFITISAHKIGGPVGAGALVHKANFPLRAQIVGGGQERGLRSGTENAPAIIGFGKAAEMVAGNIKRYIEIEQMRDKIESEISIICPSAIFYGKNTLRLPNTSMILMPGIDAQKQLIQFDLNDISVSAGSACSSGKMKTSYVLAAMGASEQDAKCSIRVSLGVDTTFFEIEKFIEVWTKIFQGKYSTT